MSFEHAKEQAATRIERAPGIEIRTSLDQLEVRGLGEIALGSHVRIRRGDFSGTSGYVYSIAVDKQCVIRTGDPRAWATWDHH